MKLLTKILPLALLIAGTAGCLKEKIEPVLAVQGEAAFTVSVPGMQTPSTRALDADKEKELTTIDVVIFSNTDNTIVEHHRVGASDIGVGTGGNDYQFRVKGIENTSNTTLAVIANAPDEVTAALVAVTTAGTYVGAAKTDFLSALQVSAGVKWNTSVVGYRTIPMYGELSVTGNIYDAVTHSINLTRMLAKVDVMNGTAPSGTPAEGDFELTAVHVVNRNTAGLIAPKWNATTGAPEPPPATTANLPGGFMAGMVPWATDGDELTYTLETDQTSLESEIYLFESAALSGNPTTPDGLRLVFEGNYTSGGVTKHYYYPIDFTTPEGAYMPVLRNHRYLFTITEAAGRGYDGLGEAVAAFGVMSNLRTSLVVVDESGIKHIIWNGEHFLGMSEKSFTVAAAGQQNIELQISTNYTGGWSAVVENPAANSWLTLGASSGSLTDKTLTFSVAVTPDEWTIRTATILLTAGRLETRIHVIQGDYAAIVQEDRLLPLDGSSQAVKIYANTPWEARLVDGGSAIASFPPASGGQGDPINGENITFVMKTATVGMKIIETSDIEIYSPTNKFAAFTVQIKGGQVIKVGNIYYIPDFEDQGPVVYNDADPLCAARGDSYLLPTRAISNAWFASSVPMPSNAGYWIASPNGLRNNFTLNGNSSITLYRYNPVMRPNKTYDHVASYYGVLQAHTAVGVNVWGIGWDADGYITVVNSAYIGSGGALFTFNGIGVGLQAIVDYAFGNWLPTATTSYVRCVKRIN